MKKLLTISLLIFCVLIIGGCGNSATTTAPTVSTSTQKIVIKKPIEADLQSHYYDFCEQEGDEAIIRFDTKTETSKVYCRFKDTTECEAEAFIKGACALGNGSITHLTETKTAEPASCPQTYEPVCGEDNLTYANSCFAVVKKIKVKTTGVCPSAKENTVEKTNTPTSNNTQTTPTLNKDKPDWLTMATDLIKSETPQAPRAYIDKCVSGSTIYYYESGGIGSFSTLYNSTGRVICYPDNDFNNSCPAYSSALNRKGNCTRLWTDNR